jgi:hypothetical protein
MKRAIAVLAILVATPGISGCCDDAHAESAQRDAGAAVDCAALAKEIHRLLDGADRSCKVASDCAPLDAEPGCPFGCFHLVNRSYLSSADHSRLEKARAKWLSSCNPCMYDCDRAPRGMEIDCREGKCADARRHRS